MASSTQPPKETDQNFSSPNAGEPSFEGTGAPSITCPRIRKSHCNFYHWDTIKGKHVERPCAFMFVSEMAYLRHIFEMHPFSYNWMKRWYMIEGDRKRVTGEVAGRLPRYAPDPGPSVIDRKAREDPVKMIQLLDLMFGRQ